MKIALFGGSFNPPHLGHRALVQKLLNQNIFDEIWILPVLGHPFGKELASFEDRLEMCVLNFLDLSKKIKVSDLEKKIKNTEGYTVHLVRYLKQNFPNEEFYWVMGSDLLQEKNRWKNFDEIEKAVSLYPISRAGHEASELPEVSSTEIREKIVRGVFSSDLLYAPVAKYILERGIYS
ncbi:MAG: nicotinate-nicotinamide nucleotide adenylyltransferase [Deltaproteobacteria bacterium]|nr:nicotinate-nicotinamide nucleotide adenylyltransferase [Deltaproteobacteria bacterium]